MFFFFFKQKTAYEMRISDWSSDVCSSDLSIGGGGGAAVAVDADGLVREPIVEQANAAPAPRTMLRSFAAASVPQGARSGGAVDVTIGAAIHTTGDQAHGVLVQSVAGGGALGGSAAGALAGGGTGGALPLTVNAAVTSPGAGPTPPALT